MFATVQVIYIHIDILLEIILTLFLLDKTIFVNTIDNEMNYRHRQDKKRLVGWNCTGDKGIKFCYIETNKSSLQYFVILVKEI